MCCVTVSFLVQISCRSRGEQLRIREKELARPRRMPCNGPSSPLKSLMVDCPVVARMVSRLTPDGSWDENGATIEERQSMERTIAGWLGITLSERVSFLIKSGIFLSVCGGTLFVALAAEYPAVHDALHNVRHALAVVPCH